MGFDGDLEPCLSKKKSLNRDQAPTQKIKICYSVIKQITVR